VSYCLSSEVGYSAGGIESAVDIMFLELLLVGGSSYSIGPARGFCLGGGSIRGR
jgi:hypothetical protein